MTNQDTSLGDLLRSTPIPVDLSEKLKQIPDREATRSLAAARTRSSEQAWTNCVAALAVAAIVVWLVVWLAPSERRLSTPGQQGPAARADNAGKQPTIEAQPPSWADARRRLAETNELLLMVQASLLGDEERRLEQRLVAASRHLHPGLLDRDQIALSMCLAEIHSTDLGRSPDSAALDLRQLIERFPGTLGAQLAERTLREWDGNRAPQP